MNECMYVMICLIKLFGKILRHVCILQRLLPLNCSRGLSGDVVGDSVDALHLVDDPGRDTKLCLHLHGVDFGSHEVIGGDTPDCTHTLVCPAVTHHAHALAGQQDHEGLGNVIVNACFTDLLDHNIVCLGGVSG